MRAPSRRVLADGEPGVFDSRAEILFPYGSDAAQVDPAVDEFLSRLAEHLQKANAAVTIVGHTDSKGTAAFNQRLGLERAEHVRDLLVGRGVAAARVRVLSEGSASPVTSNETEEGRSRNRRVEILLQDSADGDG